MQIVWTTDGANVAPDQGRAEGTRLDHDHVGCGPGYGGSTGNSAAVEENELTCCVLGQFIPEGLLRDPSDLFDRVSPFSGSVRPLWRLLDPLQRDRFRVLDSLVASDEILSLEPDD